MLLCLFRLEMRGLGPLPAAVRPSPFRGVRWSLLFGYDRGRGQAVVPSSRPAIASGGCPHRSRSDRTRPVVETGRCGLRSEAGPWPDLGVGLSEKM